VDFTRCQRRLPPFEDAIGGPAGHKAQLKNQGIDLGFWVLLLALGLYFLGL
jgi:hypothetical protein